RGGHPGARLDRGCRNRRPPGARASATYGPRTRGLVRPHSPRRCHLSGLILPRGGGRLRGRTQPRAADRTHGAVRLRIVGVRFPQAHDMDVRRSGGVAADRTGGGDAGRGRGTGRARPLRRVAVDVMVHPLHGPNRFKLGVFAANADGGLALTRVPERWPALWPEIVEVAQMADRAGIEFFLPIARWKGFGGETNSREWSFETLTFAAALAGVTERIGLFSTVHVPMIHPVYAAKALSTVDHAAGGRAGLNIVCGWNPSEFDLFGLEMIEDRYAQGLEWVEVMRRLFAGGPPFDYDGRFYKLRGVSGLPAPVQRPRPVTLNAAFSPVGRDFAARTADFLFTTFTEIEAGRGHVEDMARRTRAMGVFTTCH